MGNYAYFYIWIHKISGEKYVGITTQEIQQRLKAHCRKGNKCRRLRNAIQKHGVDAFDVEYFEWCDPWDLAYIEGLLIDELETLSPNGYNLKKGGGKHGSLSEETKKKISESNIGKQYDEETKKRMSDAQQGEKKSYVWKTTIRRNKEENE